VTEAEREVIRLRAENDQLRAKLARLAAHAIEQEKEIEALRPALPLSRCDEPRCPCQDQEGA
jgi:hypothetical protein